MDDLRPIWQEAGQDARHTRHSPPMGQHTFRGASKTARFKPSETHTCSTRGYAAMFREALSRRWKTIGRTVTYVERLAVDRLAGSAILGLSEYFCAPLVPPTSRAFLTRRLSVLPQNPAVPLISQCSSCGRTRELLAVADVHASTQGFRRL